MALREIERDYRSSKIGDGFENFGAFFCHIVYAVDFDVDNGFCQLYFAASHKPNRELVFYCMAENRLVGHLFKHQFKLAQRTCLAENVAHTIAEYKVAKTQIFNKIAFKTIE